MEGTGTLRLSIRQGDRIFRVVDPAVPADAGKETVEMPLETLGLEPGDYLVVVEEIAGGRTIARGTAPLGLRSRLGMPAGDRERPLK